MEPRHQYHQPNPAPFLTPTAKRKRSTIPAYSAVAPLKQPNLKWLLPAAFAPAPVVEIKAATIAAIYADDLKRGGHQPYKKYLSVPPVVEGAAAQDRDHFFTQFDILLKKLRAWGVENKGIEGLSSIDNTIDFLLAKSKADPRGSARIYLCSIIGHMERILLALNNPDIDLFIRQEAFKTVYENLTKCSKGIDGYAEDAENILYPQANVASWLALRRHEIVRNQAPDIHAKFKEKGELPGEGMEIHVKNFLVEEAKELNWHLPGKQDSKRDEFIARGTSEETKNGMRKDLVKRFTDIYTPLDIRDTVVPQFIELLNTIFAKHGYIDRSKREKVKKDHWYQFTFDDKKMHEQAKDENRYNALRNSLENHFRFLRLGHLHLNEFLEINYEDNDPPGSRPNTYFRLTLSPEELAAKILETLISSGIYLIPGENDYVELFPLTWLLGQSERPAAEQEQLDTSIYFNAWNRITDDRTLLTRLIAVITELSPVIEDKVRDNGVFYTFSPNISSEDLRYLVAVLSPRWVELLSDPMERTEFFKKIPAKEQAWLRDMVEVECASAKRHKEREKKKPAQTDAKHKPKMIQSSDEEESQLIDRSFINNMIAAMNSIIASCGPAAGSLQEDLKRCITDVYKIAAPGLISETEINTLLKDLLDDLDTAFTRDSKSPPDYALASLIINNFRRDKISALRRQDDEKKAELAQDAKLTRALSIPSAALLPEMSSRIVELGNDISTEFKVSLIKLHAVLAEQKLLIPFVEHAEALVKRVGKDKSNKILLDALNRASRQDFEHLFDVDDRLDDRKQHQPAAPPSVPSAATQDARLEKIKLRIKVNMGRWDHFNRIASKEEGAKKIEEKFADLTSWLRRIDALDLFISAVEKYSELRILISKNKKENENEEDETLKENFSLFLGSLCKLSDKSNQDKQHYSADAISEIQTFEDLITILTPSAPIEQKGKEAKQANQAPASLPTPPAPPAAAQDERLEEAKQRINDFTQKWKKLSPEKVDRLFAWLTRINLINAFIDNILTFFSYWDSKAIDATLKEDSINSTNEHLRVLFLLDHQIRHNEITPEKAGEDAANSISQFESFITIIAPTAAPLEQKARPPLAPPKVSATDPKEDKSKPAAKHPESNEKDFESITMWMPDLALPLLEQMRIILQTHNLLQNFVRITSGLHDHHDPAIINYNIYLLMYELIKAQNKHDKEKERKAVYSLLEQVKEAATKSDTLRKPPELPAILETDELDKALQKLILDENFKAASKKLGECKYFSKENAAKLHSECTNALSTLLYSDLTSYEKQIFCDLVIWELGNTVDRMEARHNGGKPPASVERKQPPTTGAVEPPPTPAALTPTRRDSGSHKDKKQDEKETALPPPIEGIVIYGSPQTQPGSDHPMWQPLTGTLGISPTDARILIELMPNMIFSLQDNMGNIFKYPNIFNPFMGAINTLRVLVEQKRMAKEDIESWLDQLFNNLNLINLSPESFPNPFIDEIGRFITFINERYPVADAKLGAPAIPMSPPAAAPLDAKQLSSSNRAYTQTFSKLSMFSDPNASFAAWASWVGPVNDIFKEFYPDNDFRSWLKTKTYDIANTWCEYFRRDERRVEALISCMISYIDQTKRGLKDDITERRHLLAILLNELHKKFLYTEPCNSAGADKYLFAQAQTANQSVKVAQKGAAPRK